MESFEQLTAQYTPMIYKIISSLNIYTNKDEFFQLGLIGLWEAHQRFDSKKGGFTNYAYTFIKGRLLTEMNENNKYNDQSQPVKEGFWYFLIDPCPTSPLEEDILLSYCKASSLTENQTKWVLYTFLKEFDVKEIAEIEHVSLSAVKSWRAGAKVRLRKLVKENNL
ncbi:sigma-70 family RNA polymerase sigma factor [Mesobacillus foraminis]|uniref:sigma-70 family RNA polymerase sigma factor n=1 Tax=Mesobacillus foraminis TaxID=279826 RepID=UPI000EF4CD26|nr:sigma-70 family RNA polymerase sigma factor [Mesobacillus foraminis]